MALELLTRKPQTGAIKPTPLLFIHGAWHGAWCWDEYWMPYLVQRGYACYAPSLRGHGKSPATKPMRLNSVNDYVSDVESVVERIEREHKQHPVLIGHSLGGFVVQKYLEKRQPPAAVLVASIPTFGALPFFTRLNLKHPILALKALFTLRLDPYVKSPKLAREHFFSPDVPQADVDRYAALLNDESWRTAFDVLILNLPRPKRVKTPLLVIGGENDKVFHVWEVQRTARSYNTTAVIVPDTAHDMMLDTNWQVAADHVLAWLAQRGL